MANPAFVACTKDVFIKVATNVTTGQLHRKSSSPSGYLQTYKLTGEAAPADNADLGVRMFLDAEAEPISSSAAIDVYVMCQGADGRLRVDV